MTAAGRLALTPQGSSDRCRYDGAVTWPFTHPSLEDTARSHSPTPDHPGRLPDHSGRVRVMSAWRARLWPAGKVVTPGR